MKLIFTFVLLYILIPAQAQISVGVRDNKYAHITYCLHDAWSFKTEHSAFSEKMGYQYLRATIGYGKTLGKIRMDISPYLGTTWNGSFYNCGAEIKVAYTPFPFFKLYLNINPHKDSDYGYKTCWAAGGSWQVSGGIAVVAEWRTIPEYRMKENRIRGGFRFTCGTLEVTPEISMPTDAPAHTLRMLVSFNYTFEKR